MAPLSHTLPLLRRQSVGCGTNGCGVIAMDVVRSHGGSRASSPGAGSTKSPKARVGTYELEGIPLAWDNEPTIRERVREKKNLCLSHDFETGRSESDFVGATAHNLKLNAPVLKPLVVMMKAHGLQLPAIDRLIAAVQEFFDMTKLVRTHEQCYQESWAIRRMIGKLKRYTYRSTPPQDWALIKNM